MKYFERIKEYILPYLLAFFLCASIFRIYDGRFFTGYNFISAAIIFLMFMFFRFMRKHKIAGTLIYIVLAFAALSLFFRFIYAVDWGEGFSKWFLSAGEDVKFRKRYFYAFLSVFPFFFSTVVYYFSIVLYRTSFLMLSSLVPCAVYVKVLTDINDSYLVCFAGLNAAMYAVNTRKNRSEGAVRRGESAYWLSAAVIVSAALLISSVIPKQGEAVYYDKFEKYFMDAGNGSGYDFSSMEDHSDNSGGFHRLSYLELYEVNAPDLLYFRRQNFDIYNAREQCFYPLKKYSEAVYGDTDGILEQRKKLDLDGMLAAMKRGYELNRELGISDRLSELESAGESYSEAEIIPADRHKANYLITSVRTFSLSRRSPDSVYRYTKRGEITSGKKAVNSGSFSIGYYREHGSREMWLKRGGADFTDTGYRDYLNKLKGVLLSGNESEMYDTVSAFERDFISAMEYKADCSYNNADIPEDIAALALEITADCVYDWQKAEALQKYFQSGEYTYDLEYIPPDNTDAASYFVFESKRGVCSDFAMAYTLMARAAGLAVRYTEGFAPQFKTGGDKYMILEKDAHAYPEVYIHNTGWLVFDPTAVSAGDYNFNIKNGAAGYTGTGFDFSVDTGLLISAVRFVCIVFSAAAAVIISVPSAVYITDNIRIRRGGVKGILLAYRRVSLIAERRFRISTKPLTPRELRELILERAGTDIAEFTALYEEVCFGGAVPDRSQSEFAYKVYRDAVRRIKKKRDRQRILDK